MSLTILEPASIEELDFEIRCNSRNCANNHPAATHTVDWHLPCHCMKTRYACTPCAARIKKSNKLGSFRMGWVCPYCLVSFLPYWNGPLVTVEPL